MLRATAHLARQTGIIAQRSLGGAVDSTGYEAGRTSAYYSKRTGKKKNYRPKLTVACDTKSHLLASAVADRGPLPDDIEFVEALLLAQRTLPFDEMLADAGHDSEASHAFIRDGLGANSIIPALRGRPLDGPPKGERRRQMYESFPKERYGQRWQIESAFSQDKRRFGSAVKACLPEMRDIELLMRVLVHNAAIIRRAILCFHQSRSDPFCFDKSGQAWR